MPLRYCSYFRRRAAIHCDRLQVAACWASLRGTTDHRLRLMINDPRFHQ
ncbi:MAG TPA: hypothetical protein VJA16_02680 [Thermoanaerobaculia bacterium]